MVAKRLDHFLISEDLTVGPWVLKYKVLVGGLSDHMSIVLEVASKGPKPPTPFKFNHRWLLEEDYKCLIRSMWKPLKKIWKAHTCFNLQIIWSGTKKVSIAWAKNHNAKAKELFSIVETKLEYFFYH
jgi:hypothetical protein